MTMTTTSDYYLTQADYADAELAGDLYDDPSIEGWKILAIYQTGNMEDK